MTSRHRFIYGLALPILIALTGCASGPPTALPTVPNVVEMNGAEARDILEEAGFDPKIESADGSMVLMASNWTVQAQNPAAGSELAEGEEVNLTVSKPEASAEPTPEESATAAPAPAPETMTTAGLTSSSARTACDEYGQVAFPYGWDPHWIIGVIASEPIADQWYFKVEVSVTNEYDAERDAVVECYVAGPDDGAIVADFIAY